jgi:hypothetical protein
MSTRRRDIRTERQARDLAKRFGWNSPMPEREEEDQVDEPAQDERVPFDVAPQQESAHG